MTVFNNREIAAAIWLLVVLVFALSRSSIRSSLFAVLRTATQWKLLAWLVSMAVYTAAIVALLHWAGVWEASMLKDTLLWFCVSGVATAFGAVTSRPEDPIISRIARDSLTVVIILEFVVNAYTFPLIAELILLPFLALITMLDVVAGSDRQYTQVKKLTVWTLAICGFALLAFALYQATIDPHISQTLALKPFLLPVLLSLLFAPYVYLFVLVTSYEQLFVRLRMGVAKDAALRRFAKLRIVLHCGLRLQCVRRLLRDHAHALMRVKERQDVLDLLE